MGSHVRHKQTCTPSDPRAKGTKSYMGRISGARDLVQKTVNNQPKGVGGEQTSGEGLTEWGRRAKSTGDRKVTAGGHFLPPHGKTKGGSRKRVP